MSAKSQPATTSQVAGWTSESPTPAQLKELFAQIDSGRITKGRLQSFLRPEQPASYKLARTILGKDFITPEEVAEARGMVYSSEQLANFVRALPSEEVLCWCRDNGFALIAGPNTEINILEVRGLKPEIFYTKSGGWYAEDKEKFAQTDKVGTGWLMLRKEEVLDSASKTWDEQRDVLNKELEYVPNAAEVAWGVTTYKLVRNVYLFPKSWVRTSSLDSGGSRVALGLFDGRGLVVDRYWDRHRHGRLGLSSARKQ